MKNTFILIYCLLLFSLPVLAQPQFYAATAYNGGSIYKYDAATKTINTVYNYQLNEVYPVGDLLIAGDGKFYGMASNGGINNTGAIYRYDPLTSAQTRLFEFNTINGAGPTGYFTQGKDGKLYGLTTNGGAHGKGVLFSFDVAASAFTKLYDFNDISGASPMGGLATGSDGKLYGLTSAGGANDAGVIFSYDPAKKTYSRLYNFDVESGAYPSGSVVVKSGKLYGVTKGGGLTDGGVLFAYEVAKKRYDTLYHFDYDAGNGASPVGNLTLGADGLFYGMTEMGGSEDAGVIYKFDAAKKKYSRLYDFNQSTGIYPASSLRLGKNKKFYGMTRGGGSEDAGVIFCFDPATIAFADVHHFDNTDGAYPAGGLTMDAGGVLYGAPTYGGKGGYGVIFSFDPTLNKYNKLREFDYASEGAYPMASLTYDTDGKYYGTTIDGGSGANGVIFSYNPATATYIKLYDFDHSDGTYHNGNLTRGKDGAFYGVTNSGGITGTGVVFSFNPKTSVYTKLYQFDNIDGAYPSGSLTAGGDGRFYGVTYYGGATYEGVIFSFNPATATYEKMYDFEGATGASPVSGLTVGLDGKMYGMTNIGGVANKGVLFSFDPAVKKYSKLKDFGDADGATPYGSLTVGRDGKLYGMTYAGGSYDEGVLFSYDPAKAVYAKLYDFNAAAGAHPYGSLTLGGDDQLYGTAYDGGGSGYGALFSFDPIAKKYSVLTNFDGTNGGNPSYSALAEYCAELKTFYRDADGDGYGNAAGAIAACSPPPGYVAQQADCNDNFINAYPGAPEVCGNGVDDNCNGVIDEGCTPKVNNVAINDVVVYESYGDALVSVSLEAPTAAPVTVYYHTLFGTAFPGLDYRSANGSVTIPAGESKAVINISLVKDGTTEKDEYFDVRIYSAQNAVISKARAVVLIKDGAATGSGSAIAANARRLPSEAATLQVSAYPNPASNYFTLLPATNGNEPATLIVSDAAGKVIEKRQQVQGGKTLQLGHAYKPGAYFIQLVQGTKRTVLTLIKQAE